MANAAISLFNWYRRYRVEAADLTLWQQSFLDAMRGAWQGLTGAGVLSGLTPSVSGLNVTIAAGIAVSDEGYLLVKNTSTVVALASPVGNPARSLVVARPLIVQATPIVRPTTPFDTVYLNQVLEAEIVVINGTPAASPAYPATQAGDVILAAYRLSAGASSLTSDDLDTNYRNDFGRNGGPLALLERGDPRCRPERASAQTITVTPSQVGEGRTRLFMYAGTAKPLIFPKTAGAFTDANTTLNFQTGAITGGDGDSPDFTPTIPTAGNFVWALVTLSSTSILSVSYGTVGTYAQCKAALKNQTSTGAGSVPTSADVKIAFVLLGSSDGTNVTEIEVVDARAPGNFSSASGVTIVTVNSANSPYTMDGSERHIRIDASAGSVVVNLPDRAANQGNTYPFDRVDTTVANTVAINRAGSDTINDPFYTTSFPLNPQESWDFFASVSSWKIRG